MKSSFILNSMSSFRLSFRWPLFLCTLLSTAFPPRPIGYEQKIDTDLALRHWSWCNKTHNLCQMQRKNYLWIVIWNGAEQHGLLTERQKTTLHGGNSGNDSRVQVQNAADIRPGRVDFCVERDTFLEWWEVQWMKALHWITELAWNLVDPESIVLPSRSFFTSELAVISWNNRPNGLIRKWSDSWGSRTYTKWHYLQKSKWSYRNMIVYGEWPLE